jgi:hypothetical protein
MASESVNEVGPVTFESDPDSRKRIVEQVEEVLQKYQHDSRWKQIEEAMEGLTDRKLGAMFGAHIGTNYALKLNGNPVRLLVVGKDNYEENHHGAQDPGEFFEKDAPGGGLTKRKNDPNWSGVQTAVWKVLQRGSPVPKRLPYFIDIGGKPVPWLSGAAFTNRYQRAIVQVENGKRGKRSLADGKGTGNSKLTQQFRDVSREVFNELLHALEPTHIVFNGLNAPQMLTIPEKDFTRLKPHMPTFMRKQGGYRRFRVPMNGNTVECTALLHPGHRNWSKGNGPYYNNVVQPILATLLDGELPEA